MTIISDFNETLIDLATQLSILCPTSVIANNLDILKQLMKREPKKMMDIFVLYILKYKKRIDAGDDNFFMNNNFDAELGEVGNKMNDNSIFQKAFEFKSIWKQLKQDNREIVKQYMQLLCQLSFDYTTELQQH